MADVEDRLVRPHGDCGDGQAFDDPVGERLEDHAVHERPGVAFVAVADDVLGWVRRLANHAPFLASGKPCPATPAQAGLLHGGDDLLR